MVLSPVRWRAVVVPQTLFNALLENNCSEHASRMSAMENSTKSAGEMLSKLTLAYNRWVDVEESRP